MINIKPEEIKILNNIKLNLAIKIMEHIGNGFEMNFS